MRGRRPASRSRFSTAPPPATMPDETTAGGARARAAYLAYRSLGTAMQWLPEPVAASAAVVVALAMLVLRRRRPGYVRAPSATRAGVGLSDREVAAWTRRGAP